MRRSRTGRRIGIAAACAAVFAGSVSGNAGVVYDLRFSDGSHTRLTSIGTYDLDLWVQVSGEDLDHANDSLVSAYVSLGSLQVNGGAVLNGGIAGGRTIAPFSGSGSRPGQPTSFGGDALGDWGGTGSDITDSGYMFCRSGVYGTWGGDVTGHAVNPTTWEFKLATFGLRVDAVDLTPGAETHFSAVKPAAITSGAFEAIYTLYREDDDGSGSARSVTNNFGSSGAFAQPGHGVRFITGPSLTWTGGADGSGTAWLDPNNWLDHQVPLAHLRSIIGSAGTAGTMGIDFGSATATGRHVVGSIQLAHDAGRSVIIENSSATTPGVLSVDGVGNLLLSNETQAEVLTFRDGAQPMRLQFDRSGQINVTNPGATMRIESTMEGAADITKTGQGRIVLTAPSALAGKFTIGAGSAVLEHGAALAHSTVMIDCDNGLDLNGLPSVSLGNLAGGGTLNLGSTLLTVGGNNSSSVFVGAISGNGALVKEGDGILRLDGRNSYTGQTTIAGGTLVVAHGLPQPGGTVRVKAGAQLDVYSEPINRAIAGDGTISVLRTATLGDAGSAAGFKFDGVLDVTNHNSVTLHNLDRAVLGVLTHLGVNSFNKTRLDAPNGILLGAGRLLTADADATILGDFTNNGIVQGPTGSGALLEFTGDVDGSGEFRGNVEFYAGFSPGQSAGQVSLQNVIFSSGSILMLEIGGTRPGIDYDQLVLNGTAQLLKGTLRIVLTNGFTPSVEDHFQLITGGTMLGQFSRIDVPEALKFEPATFYRTGSVPEPGASGLLLGLAAAQLLPRRRRG